MSMHIWCRRVILALIFLAVGAWLTAYIRQLVLARRAAALLVDMRAFQVKPDTWNDAQHLMLKWGRSGSSLEKCDSADCDFRIRIEHLVPFMENDVDEKGLRKLVHRLLDHLGLRSWMALGNIRVHLGAVVASGYCVIIEVPVHQTSSEDAYIPDLPVCSEMRSSFRSLPTDYLALHPNRAYSNFKEPDYTLYVAFTPQETSAERDALMDFHLNCLSQWVPCRSRGDVLPVAFKEYEGELDRLERGDRDQFQKLLLSKCPAIVGAVGRDNAYVFVGEVLRVEGSESDPELQRMIVRVDENLKGRLLEAKGDQIEVQMLHSWMREINVGSRLLLAGNDFDGKDAKNGDRIFTPHECGSFDANAQNLEMARRGIAEDYGSQD